MSDFSAPIGADKSLQEQVVFVDPVAVSISTAADRAAVFPRVRNGARRDPLAVGRGVGEEGRRGEPGEAAGVHEARAGAGAADFDGDAAAWQKKSR